MTLADAEHPGPARLTPRRWLAIVVGLALALAGVGVAAVLVGWANPFRGDLPPEVARSILFELRLPRVVLAGMIGGALAVSGAVFQALIRNPLASPYVLGISSGGALGAVIALSLGIPRSMAGLSSTTVFAFAGSLGALLLVMAIARRGSRLPRHTLLLTGVVVNAFFGSAILFLHYLAPFETSQRIVHWMMGFVPWEDPGVIVRCAPFVLAGSAVAMLFARPLNLMSLGEEQARALGVEVRRARWTLFLVASLLTGAAVSFCGPIGFVGLVVPHLVRLAFGADHRVVLPGVFLAGASFLIAADAVARTVQPRGEMPVGIVTAMIGGPFFLWLLRQNIRKAIFD